MKIISNNTHTVVGRSVSVAALVSTMLLASNVIAASQCKGLDNGACSQNNACGWVEGYERKDGRKVKSFCRTKARPKLAKSAVKK